MRCFLLGPPGCYIATTPGRLSAVPLSVEGWQLSRALQDRVRRDDAIVESTVDKSSFAAYSPDSKDVSAGG
jgi:hypothetical protein